MDEILKKVVEIDKNAQLFVLDLEKKDKNIEETIQEEIQRRKAYIEQEAEMVLRGMQSELQQELINYETRIRQEAEVKKNKIEQDYQRKKEHLIEQLYKKIIEQK